MAKIKSMVIVATFALYFVIIPARVCKAALIPEDAEDWEWIRELIEGKSLRYPKSENWNSYYKDILIESAGAGLGIAVIIGLLMTLFSIAFYCRGQKRKKISERIAKGRGQYDTKKLGMELEETARRQRRNLWIGLLICFAGYTTAAGLAYQSIIGSEKTFSRSLDGTHKFLTELQLFLCDIDGGWDCHQGSIGEYLFNIKGTVDGTLDGVVTWLRDLNNLTDSLDNAKTDLEEIDETLGDIEQTLTSINSNVGDINTMFSKTLYDDIDFNIDLQTVEASDIESIQSNRDAVQKGIVTIESSRDEVFDAIGDENSTVKALEYQIDEITGNELASAPLDLRQAVTDIVYAMVYVFSDVTTDVNDIQIGPLNDLEEIADVSLKPAAATFAGVLFLPAFILFLAILCVVAVSSPKPLYATMVFSFLFQGAYFLVGGILLLSAHINEDICTSHETIIQNLWSEPLVVPRGPGEIVIANPPISWGEGILDTLNCKDEPEASPSTENNLVDILGITDYFNISTYLLQPTELLTSEKDTLTLLLQDRIKDAQEPLTGIGTFDVSSLLSEFDIDSVIDDFTTKLEQSPPADFNRDNYAQALLFENEYLSDQLFQWSDSTSGQPLYSDSLIAVNDILTDMLEATNFMQFPPFTFLQDIIPLDFTTGKDILTTTAFCAGSDFEDTGNTGTTDGGYTIYTGGGQDDGLCNAVTVFQGQTDIVNNLDDINAAFVTDLEDTLVILSEVKSGLMSLDSDQEEVLNGIDNVNSTIDQMGTPYNQIDELVASIEYINDITLMANEYTRCGFIGNMYNDVALGAVCGDFHHDLLSAAAPVIAVGCFMFISFLLIGFCGYTIRRHDISPVTEQDDHMFFKGNKGGYQNIERPTPPASPIYTPTAYLISK